MFGLSPAMTGGIIGLAFGAATFVAIRLMINRLEFSQREKQNTKQLEAMKTMALVDLFLFPVIGYVVGPMIFS